MSLPMVASRAPRHVGIDETADFNFISESVRHMDIVAWASWSLFIMMDKANIKCEIIIEAAIVKCIFTA